MQENASLSATQERVITALVAGSTIVGAALACHVHEATVHRWLKQPAFKQALTEARKQASDVLWDKHMQELAEAAPLALAAMKTHLKAQVRASGHTQMTAVALLFDKLIELKKMSKADELEARIAELEARLMPDE